VLLRYSAFLIRNLENLGHCGERLAYDDERARGENLLAGEAPSKQAAFLSHHRRTDAREEHLRRRTNLAGRHAVHAYALLERRRLYEWVFEPMISAALRMSSDEDS
jgi:hypothetical protein